MTDKSFVALDCCPLCNEPKGIAMDNKLKPVFDKREICTSPEPCDKCKEKLKSVNHIVFYEANEDKENFTPTKKQPFPHTTGKFIEFPLDCIKKDTPGYDFLEKYRFGFADLETIKGMTEFLESMRKKVEEKEKENDNSK